MSNFTGVDPFLLCGGYALRSNSIALQPKGVKQELTYRKKFSAHDARLLLQANELFEKHSTVAIALVENEEVLFEKYRFPAGKNIPLFSWSMCKSLIGYLIGYVIDDINLPGSHYSKDLEGTVFGEATVRDMLIMASGVDLALNSGNHRENQWQVLSHLHASNLDILRFLGDRRFQSGKLFNYSSTDTQALANIIDNNGGFLEKFSKYIWHPSNAQSLGHWYLDKDGKVMAQAGFSATLQDWIRLAIFFSKETHDNPYIKEANSKQIRNILKTVGGYYPWYGYQTWIRDDSSFWWNGSGGQRVAVDYTTNRILIVFSTEDMFIGDAYLLFKKFQEKS